MSTAGIRASRAGRLAVVRGEVGKLSAFLRRDFLVAWSYRLSFVTDWASMIVQVIVFNFVSKIVRVGAVPDFGGTTPTYMEYVAVGIAISSFMAVGLGREPVSGGDRSSHRRKSSPDPKKPSRR